jgi:acyl-CoA synthetase (AMP-forming)/AMP-acid ligase II
MKTIGDLIEHNARYFGSREAFLYEGRRLSHGQFAERSRRLVSSFYAAGLRRGDRIAILAMNCQETWDIFGAAELGGFVAVPINFRLAAAEVLYMLQDTAPKAIVFEPDLLALAIDYRTASSDIAWIEIGERQQADWASPFEAFVAAGDPGEPPIRSGPEDPVYIFYTSGTTGRPKGAILKQRNVVAATRMNALESELPKGGTWLVHSPQFHIGANGPRLGQQYQAGRTILHRSFQPEAALREIQTERVTGTMTVGTMLQAVLDVAGDYDLSSMQAWMVAGAPASPELMRRAIARLGKIFVIQYGMTEGRVSGLYRFEVDPDAGPKAAQRLRSVGRSSPEIKLRICDEAGEDCPPGVPGEVVFQSDGMFAGYWNNSVATTETLRDGWVHSGDVGYLDEENFLFLVDRKKDMIISGGENIYSREVEDALSAHPDVIEAAVIGIPDEKWGEAVKAFVILAPEAVMSEDQAIEHCRTLIARYKCPKFVEFVSGLPRVPNGKIDKKALRSIGA